MRVIGVMGGVKIWRLKRIAVVAILTARLADAQELRGPTLGAASNFGQGYLPDLMDQAHQHGINDFRDAVYWDRVERAGGQYVFDTDETEYPDQLYDHGATLSLTVNNGHPAYDNGNTPTQPDDVAAFARHAAATAARFPAITAIEVGNEFNGQNFVSGPVKDTGIDARAQAYAALLAAVSSEAKAVRPDIRIIGGGVHSIPTGYLQKLVDLGAADHMDALALHPYSTPIEHLAKQIAVLRTIPELADIPIEITEFGSQSETLAPGVLLRSHCQYALSGVSRIVWYGLNERGDNYVPLITRAGAVTDAWRAFEFARTELAGKTVRNVAPDDFTYACLYDDRKLVIWGMPRGFSITSDNVQVFDVAGNLQPGTSFMVSETAPLVVIAPENLSFVEDLAFDPQPVIADSYHQLVYDMTYPKGFDISVQTAGVGEPVETMLGQDKPGRPWTPWLGIPNNPDVRVLPGTLQPAGNAGFPVAVVHSFTAPESMVVDVQAMFDPADRSTDGIDVTLAVDGVVLQSWSGRTPVDHTEEGVALAVGQTLTVAVGPGQTSTGDVTDYRITLRHAGH